MVRIFCKYQTDPQAPPCPPMVGVCWLAVPHRSNSIPSCIVPEFAYSFPFIVHSFVLHSFIVCCLCLASCCCPSLPRAVVLVWCPHLCPCLFPYSLAFIGAIRLCGAVVGGAIYPLLPCY